MPLQKKLARVGLAKQAAKGGAATDATFAFGVRDGGVFKAELPQEREEITQATSLVAPAANRGLVVPGAEFGTRAYAGSIGLLLYAALGGISTAGAGPYTHTITPATARPWLSAFGFLDGNYVQAVDCMVDELEISWSGVEPLEVSASMIGRDLDFPTDFGTVVNDEELAAYFRPVGGTFKVDVDSDTPVTASVKAGTVKIANNVEAIELSHSATPGEVWNGAQDIDAGLTLVPDNIDAWRTILTGTAAGTDVSAVPIYGSFEVQFNLDANTFLKLAASHVAFAAEFPEPDSGGGSVEIPLEGLVVRPAAGAPFTATVKNAIVSY